MKSEERRGQGRDASASDHSILVLGVGNILLSDEGVGVRIIETMATHPLPENVELLDGGTASVGLMDVLAGRDKVVIVDAVKGGGDPGTIYRFTPDDVTQQKDVYISLHQVSLLEILTYTEYLGDAPRSVVIIGIEPKTLSWGIELSPEVSAVIPRVIELVKTELGI